MNRALGHVLEAAALRREVIAVLLLATAVAAGLWAIRPTRGPASHRSAVKTAQAVPGRTDDTWGRSLHPLPHGNRRGLPPALHGPLVDAHRLRAVGGPE